MCINMCNKHSTIIIVSNNNYNNRKASLPGEYLYIHNVIIISNNDYIIIIEKHFFLHGEYLFN